MLFANLAKGNFCFIHFKRYFCQELAETYVKALVRCEIQIDPEVEENLKNGSNPKKHPGRRSTTPVKVPERFLKAVHGLLQTKNLKSKDLLKDAQIFRNHFACRKLPAADDEVRLKAGEILAQVAEKDGIDMEELNDEERECVEQSRKDKMVHKLKTMVYNWQPVEYNEHNSILYLLGCFPPYYASLCKIFSEIRSSVPDFKPSTFLDFGSGVGSGIWAANESFEGSIIETLCIDASGEISDVTQMLLQDGDPNGDKWIKNIFFRRFLPPSNLIKYDLVLCAHSLMDMPTARERLQVINNLWNKTQDMLVIVEHGSYAGHNVVLEAREYILNKFNANPEKKEVHVVAPCQHDLPCPKLLTTEKRPCSFPAKFHPINFHVEKNPEMEKYSYVVLSKKKHKEDAKWPRLISPVLKRSGHVVCRMCNVNGRLYENIATKFNCGSSMYKLAKHSYWGDVLPCIVDTSKVSSDVTGQEPDSSSNETDSDKEDDSEESVVS